MRSDRGAVRTRTLTVVIVGILLLVGVDRVFVARDSGPPTGTAATIIVDVARAREELPRLPVKGRAPTTGYDRDEFGSGWSDPDGNGCDTRNDILARDLVDTRMRDDCIVESGLLLDPYSGDVIEFTRGQDTSAEVQIDHVVSLSNAWQTGAQYWDDDRREVFANDPANLLAVGGALNQQKGAGDAATWLPPQKEFRCEFVAIQVLVKSTHGLWVTAPEKAAMERHLADC